MKNLLIKLEIGFMAILLICLTLCFTSCKSTYEVPTCNEINYLNGTILYVRTCNGVSRIVVLKDAQNQCKTIFGVPLGQPLENIPVCQDKKKKGVYYWVLTK
jgi:hypothetical protein